MYILNSFFKLPSSNLTRSHTPHITHHTSYTNHPLPTAPSPRTPAAAVCESKHTRQSSTDHLRQLSGPLINLKTIRWLAHLSTPLYKMAKLREFDIVYGPGVLTKESALHTERAMLILSQNSNWRSVVDTAGNVSPPFPLFPIAPGAIA